ncbi:MAG: hypothetical protein JO218_06555 [Burkholderiales bacterium]|nr:hypothetical protein [Roseateles sp.]MBV8465588.1 hypothetical protein [Burkholderiales bacterium]
MSLHDASWILAAGAPALAHSTSSSASDSLPASTPELLQLLQLLPPLAGAGWTCVSVAEP